MIGIIGAGIIGFLMALSGYPIYNFGGNGPNVKNTVTLVGLVALWSLLLMAIAAN